MYNYKYFLHIYNNKIMFLCNKKKEKYKSIHKNKRKYYLKS